MLASAKLIRNREIHLDNLAHAQWLPPYSPKLNPVEQSWKHTKYDDLPNFIPDNLDHLYDHVYDSQKNQHQDQAILRSFFAHAKLPL